MPGHMRPGRYIGKPWQCHRPQETDQIDQSPSFNSFALRERRKALPYAGAGCGNVSFALLKAVAPVWKNGGRQRCVKPDQKGQPKYSQYPSAPIKIQGGLFLSNVSNAASGERRCFTKW